MARNVVYKSPTNPESGPAYDSTVQTYGGGGGGDVTSVNGQTGDVILETDDISDSGNTNKYVTQAEKNQISTALQPGDNVSELVNDAGYITLAAIPVTSVNGQTGDVVLDADDIDDSLTTNKFATQQDLDDIQTNNLKVSADGSINTHNDVDLTGLMDDFILQYNLGTGNFEPVDPSTIVGGGGAGIDGILDLGDRVTIDAFFDFGERTL